MFKKLFGGKKNEFFLELDDSKNGQTSKPAEAKKPAAKPAAKAEVADQQVTEEKAKAKNSKKTSVKKAAKKEVAKSATAPVTPAAMNGNVAKKAEPTEVEFATKYLIMPTGSRRRPGPSLNAFKDMARQAKVPRA